MTWWASQACVMDEVALPPALQGIFFTHRCENSSILHTGSYRRLYGWPRSLASGMQYIVPVEFLGERRDAIFAKFVRRAT